MNPGDELVRLREENRRLKALLELHGIAYVAESHAKSEHTAQEKLAIFRRLFRGRTDVYARRWEGKNGKTGYSPVCRNEWRRPVCQKPRIKCSECDAREYMPFTDRVLYDHLSGKVTAGIYPLMDNDTCFFLAVDFDEETWKDDAEAFMETCRDEGIPAYLEISRSGKGAHIWVFFEEETPARLARELGSALVSITCRRTGSLSLKSYDRFFPNQDTLPKGGLGNLIALPLQRIPRNNGCSIFCGPGFTPQEQWCFLESVRRLSPDEFALLHRKVCSDGNPLDVAFCDEDDEPWKRRKQALELSGDIPSHLTVVLSDRIYLLSDELTPQLRNRVLRLASFRNPEFYKAQALRLPVWDKARVICCADLLTKHIAIPRGCLDGLLAMMKTNGIRAEIHDERISGTTENFRFLGRLSLDQHEAVKAVLSEDTGILCAPTGFGKTVIGAAVISERKVSTLVLVHRKELLRQWKERLTCFLGIEGKDIGEVSSGKRKLSGRLDIALLQSLRSMDDIDERLAEYGQVIIDECHHIAAFTFEEILKRCRSRYVLGLTATPERRDGHQPIIRMQCGLIRHKAGKRDGFASEMAVIPTFLDRQIQGHTIQEIYQEIINDAIRNGRIIHDVLSAYAEGRKILLLTERTDHLMLLKKALEEKVDPLFCLHGRMPARQRRTELEAIRNFPAGDPHVIVATGKLIGEGFDHAPLDTLVLGMPISWKGDVQQYVGRLHRNFAGKQDVRVYDYVDLTSPSLVRMWNKRLAGYRALGYAIDDDTIIARMRQRRESGKEEENSHAQNRVGKDV